jgi:hypothetical protein
MELSRFECAICTASNFSWKALIVFTVFCGWIALEAPVDVLSTNPFLESFTVTMEKAFPVIRNYAQKSTFPEITRLYMSLMFLGFPLGLLAPLCTMNTKDKRLFVPIQNIKLKNDVSLGKYLLSCFLILILIPPAVYILWFVNPGYNFAMFKVNESRLGLATGGFFISLVVAFLIGAFIHLSVRFILGFLVRRS